MQKRIIQGDTVICIDDSHQAMKRKLEFEQTYKVKRLEKRFGIDFAVVELKDNFEAEFVTSKFELEDDWLDFVDYLDYICNEMRITIENNKYNE